MRGMIKVMLACLAIIGVCALGALTASAAHAAAFVDTVKSFDGVTVLALASALPALPAPLPVGPAMEPIVNAAGQVIGERPANTLLGRKVIVKGAFRVYEAWLYDTMQYAAAGLAGAPGILQFFQTPANGAVVTTCNMPTPGRLPRGQYFHPYRLFATILQEPSVNVAGTAAGRVADIFKLLYIARSFIRFSQQSGQVNRTPIPLEALGAPSSVLAALGGTNTAQSLVMAGTQDEHGGHPFTEVLEGDETFAFDLLTGVQTAVSAAVDLRLGLYGWQYVGAQ